MADPFTAAQGASMAISAGGTLMKLFGGNEEAEASAKMHEYKAGIARKNAQILRTNSDWTLSTGERNARISGLTTGFKIGTQRAGQSASGFDVNTGSAEAVRDVTRRVGYEDQSTIRTESGRKALGFRNAAAMADEEAAMELAAASNARKAGRISGLSTLLGGAGSVADKWAKASKVGGAAGSGITTYDENFLPVAFTPT